MNVSAVLRAARLRAGLTQSDLARLAGTSQATISAYEHGAKIPSAATLSRVLAAAGMRLTTAPATRIVRTPTRAELAERGEILSEVIQLAEALPYRPVAQIRYPRLPAPRPGS